MRTRNYPRPPKPRYYTQGHFTKLQNYTFTAENIFALIAFITSVWMLVYMGWVVHGLRVVPRFTNTLLACCGRKYSDVYYVSWFFDRGDR